MKKKFIAGNWKMNKTAAEAEEFCRSLLVADDFENVVVLFVPFTDIAACAQVCRGSCVKIGAQNVHWEQSGAFTGEISAAMLIEAGAEYVLVGHSERRTFFGETDDTVSERLSSALRTGLKPVVCVGETFSERQSGNTEKVIKGQLMGALSKISAEEAKRVAIAYEPVWAIGTGVTATADQAQETMSFVRSVVSDIFGNVIADAMYILYGGSMNEKNAVALLKQSDIDGGLIGGASLDPEKFIAILKAGELGGKRI